MKSQRIKTFFLIGIILFLVLSFSNYPQETKAGAEHNVSGYAWSENIGWISFNNTSGGGSANYGVNIEPDSVFSGYAWSEHIGWISFNESDLTGCPVAPCRAWVDISCLDGQCPIYGWARALAGGTIEAGGWDGWIRLRESFTVGLGAEMKQIAAGETKQYLAGSPLIAPKEENLETISADNQITRQQLHLLLIGLQSLTLCNLTIAIIVTPGALFCHGNFMTQMAIARNSIRFR